MTTQSVAIPPLLAMPLAAVLMLSLGACAPNESVEPQPAPDAPMSPAGDAAAMAPAAPAYDTDAMCDADAAQSFVGQDASEATLAAAKEAAGAKGDLRVIEPGQPVTMDYRADRLNVEVDADNAIVRISCG